MRKNNIWYCVIVVWRAAAADSLEEFAEGDSLASPTPRPIQWITAPEICGEIPQIAQPEGE
jgi:hypothetical protein